MEMNKKMIEFSVPAPQNAFGLFNMPKMWLSVQSFLPGSVLVYHFIKWKYVIIKIMFNQPQSIYSRTTAFVFKQCT